MTEGQIINAFSAMDRDDQIVFLARLIDGLTISIRGYYSLGAQAVNSEPGSPVGCLNEIQHVVAGYLRCLTADARESSLREDFVRDLIERANYFRIGPDILFALQSAIPRSEPLLPAEAAVR